MFRGGRRGVERGWRPLKRHRPHRFSTPCQDRWYRLYLRYRDYSFISRYFGWLMDWIRHWAYLFIRHRQHWLVLQLLFYFYFIFIYRPKSDFLTTIVLLSVDLDRIYVLCFSCLLTYNWISYRISFYLFPLLIIK